LLEFGSFSESLFFDHATQVGKQGQCCIHAHIGGDEYALQFFVQIIVYLAATTKQLAKLAAGTRQARF
jgi:hypothetical protein